MPEEYYAINHSMSRRTPSTMDSAGILAEVVALNGAKGTITLGTGTWRIDIATVTPTNVRLVLEQGAMLTKYGSVTLTINGPVDAPNSQWLSGWSAGDVRFAGNRKPVNAKWFTVHDGITDDAVGLATWFESVAPNLDPATHPRPATAALYLPAGDYATSVPVGPLSMEGLRVFGDGANVSRILGRASGMSCVLDINGTATSDFCDFSVGTIASGDTEVGLWVHWDASSYRSSSRNRFRDISVGGKFVTGIKIGQDSGQKQGDQVDQSDWHNCCVDGLWTEAENTWWQTGWQVGDHYNGNCLIHTIHNISATWCRVGVDQSSQMKLVGGIIQSCEIDIVSDCPSYTLISGIRSEASKRFLSNHRTIGSVSGSHTLVEVNNCNWKCDSVAEDGMFIVWGRAGTLVLRNLGVSGGEGLSTLPRIIATAGPYPQCVVIDGGYVGGDQSVAGYVESSRNTVVHETGLATLYGWTHGTDVFYGSIIKGRVGLGFARSGQYDNDSIRTAASPDAQIYRDEVTGRLVLTSSVGIQSDIPTLGVAGAPPGRWRGVLASAPVADLQPMDTYKNSGDSTIYMYDGTGWNALN